MKSFSLDTQVAADAESPFFESEQWAREFIEPLETHAPEESLVATESSDGEEESSTSGASFDDAETDYEEELDGQIVEADEWQMSPVEDEEDDRVLDEEEFEDVRDFESPFVQENPFGSQQVDDSEQVFDDESAWEEDSTELEGPDFDEEAEESTFQELWNDEMEEEDSTAEDSGEWEESDHEVEEEEEEAEEANAAFDSWSEEFEESEFDDDELEDDLIETDPEEEHLTLGEVEQEIATPKIPTPGQFYRIRKGDSLLKVAGRAYGAKGGKERLAFAKFLASDSFNRRYLVQPKGSFSKRHFPQGIISFLPKFDCDAEALLKASGKAPKGKCFALIWIPPKAVNSHPILGKGQAIPLSSLKRILGQEAESGELESELMESEIPVVVEFVKGNGGIVGDDDDRKKVASTQRIPHRWICLIEVFFPDPDDHNKVIGFTLGNPVDIQNHLRGDREAPGVGSGVLISQRDVLTAAHVLHAEIAGSKGTRQVVTAEFARINPGLNRVPNKKPMDNTSSSGAGNPGGEKILFFDSPVVVSKKDFYIPKEFRNHPLQGNDQKGMSVDYAVIKAPRNIHVAARGWWGSKDSGGGTEIVDGSKFAAFANKSKSLNKGKTICTAGYPNDADKILGQWKSEGTVLETDMTNRLIEHTADVTSGMSGGPLWVELGNGRNVLVGISSVSKDEIIDEVLLRTRRGKIIKKLTLRTRASRGVMLSKKVIDDIRNHCVDCS